MGVQTGRSNAALGMLDQATSALQRPMNWSNLPARQNLQNTAGGWRQTAQDAVTELQQPYLDRRRSMSNTQLANQGITRGSEAWRDQQMQLGDEEARANLQAIGSGRQEADMLFGQDLQSAQFGNQNRQQAISEQMMRRNQPLNELNALLTGQQVQSPQMPGFQPAGRAPGADLLGAANSQYDSSMDAYNAQQAGLTSTMAGLFGLGRGAMGAGGWGNLFSL
jgi:hypothetical protein